MASYSDMSQLAGYAPFQAQVVLSVVHYAKYILNTQSAMTGRKCAWAFNAVNNPLNTAQQIYNVVAQDAIFSGQGVGLGTATMLTNVTDAEFETAVETAINTTLLSS